MYENNNYIYSNIFKVNNKYKINPLKSSNKNQNNIFKRVLSAGNIRRNSTNIKIYKKYHLPTLNSNSLNLKMKKNLLYNSMPKNIQFETEKLYEESMGYKKTINKIQTEINMIKLELSEKKRILNSMNEEIEKILCENKDKLNIDFQKKIPDSARGRYIMIGKMKNKMNEAEINLNNQIYINKKNKKNSKLTKSYELEIEKNILNQQKEKLLSLIKNCLILKKNQEKELEENNQYINKIKSQDKIISNFSKKLEILKDEEQKLRSEIVKYENLLNKTNDKVKIIKIKHVSLKDLNTKLQEEKNKFNKKNKGQSLEELKKELSSTKDYYNYCKLSNQKITEKLNIMKGRYKIEQIDFNNNNDNNNDSETVSSESENDSYGKYSFINGEENISRLQKIYTQNKKKENELEKNLFLYQEAIQKMNDGEKVNIEEIKNKIIKIIKEKDLNDEENITNENNDNVNDNGINNYLWTLSIDNPYFTNNEDNDSIISNKFNNRQFNQFTYVLFKNFAAKKIDNEQGKIKIINPLIDYFKVVNKEENPNKEITKEAFIQGKLNEKFCEIIKNLLKCDFQDDIINLKIYFNIIYFEKVTNSNKKLTNENKLDSMTNYLLSLFNQINEYTEKEEKSITRKIKSKYSEQINKLREAINVHISSKNKKNDVHKNNINDYISIQEIKYILDKNKDLKLKEKYIEFIVYYMKQFDDRHASLFDLKISKLDEILKEEKKEDNNNKSDKPKEQLSDEEFKRNINSVLIVIKQIMIDENKNLRNLFENDIVKIENTDKEIIYLESLNKELNKRNIILNDLQIICIKKKYCMNEQKDELEIKQIEDDINNFKK